MAQALFSNGSPPPEQIYGVSRVVRYIGNLIAQSRKLTGIWVRGEVSGCNENNGRLYFDLKEGLDLLHCIVWPNDVSRLPPLKNGDEVICGGAFGTWAQRSQYQLVVKQVQHVGKGALYAQFEALKEAFRKEGLFETARKRPLPAFPQRIAVVSARGSSGVEDFLVTIARRAPFVQIAFVETRVQGEGAQIEIADALDRASRLDVDAIVLTRGGGSYEDRFAFNTEPVVRAIVRARHPVLTAIGHEPDTHLADFVADKSCETPSNAAQYFGAIGDALAARVLRARNNLERHVTDIALAAAQRFDQASGALRAAASRLIVTRLRSLRDLERRLEPQSPHARLTARSNRLSGLRARLDAAGRSATQARRVALSRVTERLNGLPRRALRTHGDRLRRAVDLIAALDPNGPLGRGYAIVTFDGHPVRDAAAVPAGARIVARVQRGKLLARVEGMEQDG